MKPVSAHDGQTANTPPVIEPVSPGPIRPQWSVMIPTFNCAMFLAEALASVLAQDPGLDLMQIEVIDDCSTRDDPESVVREIGRGRVVFHRQPLNVGVVENFNTCIRRSCGRLVHILHGDDYALPGFYDKIEAASARHPGVGIFITRCFDIEENGNLRSLSNRLQFLERPASTLGNLLYFNSIRTPSVVVPRATYEKLGGFLPSLFHCADWEMWVRCIYLTTALAINEPLASYRISSSSDTGKLQRTGEDIRDNIRLASIWKNHFPDFDERRFIRYFADLALHQARRFRTMGDIEAYHANLAVWRDIVTLRGRVTGMLRGVWHLIR